MTNDPLAALPIGRKVTVSKTVSESDVYLFAGITGDFSPNHTDEAYMRKTRYGRRIAHGALAIGFMSNASTKILADASKRASTLVHDWKPTGACRRAEGQR